MGWLDFANGINADLSHGITLYVDPKHDGGFSWKVIGRTGCCLDGEEKRGVVAEGLADTLNQAKMLASTVGSAHELFATLPG